MHAGPDMPAIASSEIAQLTRALRMSHTSYVFLVWANIELWRLPDLRPAHTYADQYLDDPQNRAWSPFPAPRLVELRETAGVRFYASYRRLQEAVGALSLAYGQEFYDEIMAVI
jgi:hypothetical protein